jgi:hypothetical protein
MRLESGLLVVDGALAANAACCCGCQACEVLQECLHIDGSNLAQVDLEVTLSGITDDGACDNCGSLNTTHIFSGPFAFNLFFCQISEALNNNPLLCFTTTERLYNHAFILKAYTVGDDCYIKLDYDFSMTGSFEMDSDEYTPEEFVDFCDGSPIPMTLVAHANGPYCIFSGVSATVQIIPI